MVQVLKQLACWLVGTEYKAGMDVHMIDDVPKKRLQSMLRAQVCFAAAPLTMALLAMAVLTMALLTMGH